MPDTTPSQARELAERLEKSAFSYDAVAGYGGLARMIRSAAHLKDPS